MSFCTELLINSFYGNKALGGGVAFISEVLVNMKSMKREMTVLHCVSEMNFHPSMMAQAWENGQRLIS